MKRFLSTIALLVALSSPASAQSVTGVTGCIISGSSTINTYSSNRVIGGQLPWEDNYGNKHQPGTVSTTNSVPFWYSGPVYPAGYTPPTNNPNSIGSSALTADEFTGSLLSYDFAQSRSASFVNYPLNTTIDQRTQAACNGTTEFATASSVNTAMTQIDDQISNLKINGKGIVSLTNAQTINVTLPSASFQQAGSKSAGVNIGAGASRSNAQGSGSDLTSPSLSQ